MKRDIAMNKKEEELDIQNKYLESEKQKNQKEQQENNEPNLKEEENEQVKDKNA